MADKKNHKIFILNGPPETGKDELARCVIHNDKYDFIKASFAQPLKEANRVLYGLTHEQVFELELDRSLKEKPLEMLGGKSWRQVNIDLSEKYLKLEHGKSFFGLSLLNRINGVNLMDGKCVIVSDGGFDDEIEVLIKEYGVNNVNLIHVVRKGKSFSESKDSRQYIDHKKHGLKEWKLENKGSLSQFLETGFKFIQNIKNSNKSSLF